MTRDEALEVTATTIREATRWVFGVWKSPAAIRAAAAVQFVLDVASDEWDALEAGPETRTEEELAIEAIQADLKARGANGISEKAARSLYKAGAHLKLGTPPFVSSEPTWRHEKPAIDQRNWKDIKTKREAAHKVWADRAVKQETGESPEESTPNAQR